MPRTREEREKLVLPKVVSLITLAVLAMIIPEGFAEVSLTVSSPAGDRTIALEESPEIEVGYTDSGMRLEFKNINVVMQCIGGDVSSESGLCLLKTYQPQTGPQTSLPGTPGTPTPQSAGAGAVTLSWSAPASDGGATITGYRIQANIDGTSSWPTVKDNTGSASTSYTVTGLTEGESYRFRVAAINSVGPGANSGSSSLITIESTGAGGLTLAQACINPPDNVVCDKTRIPADFYTTWGSGELTQPASKILSMPFIVEESTTADGEFAYKSFMSSVTAATDYTFNLWISETPNGPLLDNNRFCQIASKSYLTVLWTQGTPGYLECGLGSANRILYVNSKLFKDEGGVEKLYPYASTPRDARYALSNSVSTPPHGSDSDPDPEGPCFSPYTGPPVAGC